jgi:hypothetical protein
MDFVKLAVAQPGKAIEIPDDMVDDGTFKVNESIDVTIKMEDGKRVAISKFAEDTEGGLKGFIVSGTPEQREAGAEAAGKGIESEMVNKGPGGFQQIIYDAKRLQEDTETDRRRVSGMLAAYTKVAQDPDMGAQKPFVDAMMPPVQRILKNRTREAGELAQAQIAMTAARAAVGGGTRKRRM